MTLAGCCSQLPVWAQRWFLRLQIAAVTASADIELAVASVQCAGAVCGWQGCAIGFTTVGRLGVILKSTGPTDSLPSSFRCSTPSGGHQSIGDGLPAARPVTQSYTDSTCAALAAQVKRS